MKKILFLFYILVLLPVSFVAAETNLASSTPVVDGVASSTQASGLASSTQVFDSIVFVSPGIIDEKFHAKELGKYNIVIKNSTNHKTDIYPVVNDVLVKDGKQEFATLSGSDRNKSLANWISFKRGAISLMPGEEETVPLNIQVAINAQPGKYYAIISLPEGPNRVSAESSMATQAHAQVMISIEITEDIIEKAELKEFSVSKGMFFKFPIDFNIKIDNFGNKMVDPHGSIFIYNRSGVEVAVLNINSGDMAIMPGKSSSAKREVLSGIGIGKYKAKLSLEYGEKGTRDLQDTVYFWVLPWKFLIVFLIVFLIMIVLLTMFLHKKTYTAQYHTTDDDI